MRYIRLFLGLTLLKACLALDYITENEILPQSDQQSGQDVLVVPVEPHEVHPPTEASIPTTILVQVIAKDGKFLGNDIGGAEITVRDVETQEILAQGTTNGGSGPNGQDGVMCEPLLRGQMIPTNNTAANFSATFSLSSPRRIEVTAFGPLAARASANTASMSTWVYPGRHITEGNGILLELSGLICQVVNPPAHTTYTNIAQVNLTANVAMMCGCPISTKPSGAICPGSTQPWLPKDFEVFAIVQPQLKTSNPIPMTWDETAAVAGKFVATVDLPTLAQGVSIFEVTVFAQQISTGQTGVDFSTFLVSSS